MDEDLDFEQWEAAIGKLLMAFARVEYELLQLYKAWLPMRDYFRDSFDQRFDKAIGACKRHLPGNNNVIGLLIKMKQWGRLRHLIAHNPIEAHVYEEGGERCVSFFIVDSKGSEERVSLADLRNTSLSAWRASVALAVELRINVQGS